MGSSGSKGMAGMCWEPGGGGVAAACYGSRNLSLSAEEGRGGGGGRRDPTRKQAKGEAFLASYQAVSCVCLVVEGEGERWLSLLPP